MNKKDNTAGYKPGRLKNNMVCYAVPTLAAIAHIIMRKNISSWKENPHHLWLGFLLAGGAIFGLVDHWWNGELFLIGENILLGFRGWRR